MRYVVATRRDPRDVPPVRYPAHFVVRKVSANSGFRWKSRFVFVTHPLMGEHIGLEEPTTASGPSGSGASSSADPMSTIPNAKCYDGSYQLKVLPMLPV